MQNLLVVTCLGEFFKYSKFMSPGCTTNTRWKSVTVALFKMKMLMCSLLAKLSIKHGKIWHIVGTFILIITKDNNNDNNSIERRSSRFVQPPHCAANCLQYVSSSCQGASVCKSRATYRAQSRATCRVSRGTKGQLSC